MPAITWGPQIQLGIEVIDSQHKRLVDLINELGQAMDDGRGPEVMAKTLTELVDYTHYHFKTEETLLHEHDYEDLKQHRREHRIFTDQIEIYKDRFESGFQSVTKALMDYLSGWLVTHITVSDRAYLETLKEGGVK
ncbi:MAG: bacteriohemerythrin [Myxococcales bacterium]|nr:bacteriohemerythrin [Myxococcales bacterium]MCB9579386.1 bacteriohemerythrin [Polyangiaceae bacterium]